MDSASQGWVNALNNGQLTRAQVAVDIATSPESQGDLAATFQTGVFVPSATDASIARLYDGLLGRAPDTAGLQNWEAAAASGTSLATIASSFISSSEFAAAHPNQTNDQFVQILYQGALGRSSAGDPGAQGWVQALNGGATKASVALGIAESPEAVTHLSSQIETGYKLA